MGRRLLMDRPIIKPYKEEDKTRVLELLSKTQLPIDDLNTLKLKNFLVAHSQDHNVAGVIGVEPFDETGLLRSLAVHNDYRSTGLGRALTIGLELMAHRLGIKTLYLLTTTATDFFIKLQYRVVQRADAPQAITGSREFSQLCPVSASLLQKEL